MYVHIKQIIMGHKELTSGHITSCSCENQIADLALVTSRSLLPLSILQISATSSSIEPYVLVLAPLAYGKNIHLTTLFDIQSLKLGNTGSVHWPAEVSTMWVSICWYTTLAIRASYRSNRPSVSNAAHMCGFVSGTKSSADTGGRVDAQRALKPRVKEGGRIEKR